MPRLVVLGALIVGLAIATVSHWSATRAQGVNPATADSGFVGTWRVIVTNPDGSAFPVLSSYLADGTALHAGPVSQPAAPGSPSAVVLQSTGLGVWEVTGAETSSVTFEVLTGDERGNFLGRLTISGVQTLDPGGDSFTGRYVVAVTDPAGNVVATVPTTATGERMRVELPPALGTPDAATPAA